MSTNSSVVNVEQQQQKKKMKKTKKKFIKKETFFNWAQLLAQFSVTVAITVYAIVQDNRDRQIAYENRQQDLFLANQTRTKDLSVAESNRFNDLLLANDQQKENILIEYQNFISDLLLKYDRLLNDTTAKFVARFKTIAALEQLNPTRRTFLIRSLIEAQLVTYNDQLESASLHPIISLTMANLTEIDLSGIDETIFLPKSDRCLAFDRAVLDRASFHKADLSGSSFINAKLDYADFSFAKQGPDKDCYKRSANPRISTTFADAHMHYANFYGASLSNVDFTFAHMVGINMSHTDLSHDIIFAHAKLERSSFYMAKFGTGYHQFGNAILTDMNGTRMRCNKCAFKIAILTNASMDDAVFNETSFLDANMNNCSMNNAILNQVKFTDTNMTNCQLKSVQLTNISFHQAIMINVDMTNMICQANCSFRKTNLTGAIFYNATIMLSNLKDATFTDEQLAQMRSLAGSTLPNGTNVPMTV